MSRRAPPKPRNPVARVARTIKPRIVQDKTKYTRKGRASSRP